MMEAYVHRVHYYETDKMGCVHHSNHVRWMEEARVAYLERIGVPFTLLEARGVYSPVVGVECRYRRPAHFDEEIRVEVRIRSFDRLRLKIGYEMIRVSDGELIATGSSEHCFTDLDGRPIALSKTHPDLDALLRAQIEPQGRQSAGPMAVPAQVSPPAGAELEESRMYAHSGPRWRQANNRPQGEIFPAER